MLKEMKNLCGTVLTTDSGKRYRLGKIIGSGTQGVIHETDSPKYLVKLYYHSGSPDIDEAVLDRLKKIKALTIPNNYVTVLDTIQTPYIGYVMERVVDHKSLNTYLIPATDKAFPEWYNSGFGLRERLLIGYSISRAFGDLERQNLSYCDISGNNILVQITQKSPLVKMIDVDNIYIAGKGKVSVLGTPRYIAPEVINRQILPDVLSDNYAMSFS